MRLSPDGTRALAKAASQLYLIDVPPAQGATVNLDTPTVRRVKLTRIGADYFDWADGGRTIAWSVGSTYRRIAVDTAKDDAEAAAPKFALDVAVPRDVPAGTVTRSPSSKRVCPAAVAAFACACVERRSWS